MKLTMNLICNKIFSLPFKAIFFILPSKSPRWIRKNSFRTQSHENFVDGMQNESGFFVFPVRATGMPSDESENFSDQKIP